MHANKGIGTVQPASEIGQLCHSHGIPFHTDACQSAGFLPVAPDRLQADLAEDRHRRSPTTRIETWLGVALMLAGVGLMTGWGIGEALLDPSVPLAVRGGLALATAGSMVLLVAAVRWRLRTRDSDSYEDVVG